MGARQQSNPTKHVRDYFWQVVQAHRPDAFLRNWGPLSLSINRPSPRWRGLAMGPELAVADGALGFWQAVEEIWPQTRGQRCWVHKTANVLNKLPNSQQPKAKRALQEIW